MATQITLGEIAVDVVFKDIKNVHLSVYPPAGRVRISAPSRMSVDTVRLFAVSKLGWIKQQQKRLQAQARETPREYLDRESHYLWGKRYLLKVVENDSPPEVTTRHKQMILQVRPGTEDKRKKEILEAWYRQRLRETVAPMIATREPSLGVKVEKVFVQQMKTKWGSCNPKSATIRINTELAKKPPECLEYLVLHEMVHLLEPTHNHRFISLMDQFMPNWKIHRQVLNGLPVKHETWQY
jgi:predicted metal-dependent hydrolase